MFDKPYTTIGNKIVIFDWKGNYIKTLESAISLRSFCVDENDSEIYAVIVTDDSEIEIMHFNF